VRERERDRARGRRRALRACASAWCSDCAQCRATARHASGLVGCQAPCHAAPTAPARSRTCCGILGANSCAFTRRSWSCLMRRPSGRLWWWSTTSAACTGCCSTTTEVRARVHVHG
jgi:hypothetical protein